MNHKPIEAEGDAAEARASGLLDKVALEAAPRLPGVTLGLLAGFDADGAPLVTFPGAPEPRPALATVATTPDMAGMRAALMFVDGSPVRPLLLGVLQEPTPNRAAEPAEARIDGERVVLEGKREVVLRCGKASITLRRDGKIVLKGVNLVSRASAMNKIKGAGVNIN